MSAHGVSMAVVPIGPVDPEATCWLRCVAEHGDLCAECARLTRSVPTMRIVDGLAPEVW